VVEEGGDMDFVPDIRVRDGDIIEGRWVYFECVHTPGHTSNHICYALKDEKALFCGDHVMGWSTTWWCRLMATWATILPPCGSFSHAMMPLLAGAWRSDPRSPNLSSRPIWRHRLKREAQIIAAMKDGVMAIPAMVERIYVGLDPRLKPPQECPCCRICCS
jgi:hypothetical protein